MDLEWEVLDDINDDEKWFICLETSLSEKELNELRDIMAKKLNATFVTPKV